MSVPLTQIISAFLVGLLGSVHCIGMCGGIVSALTLTLPDKVRQHSSQVMAYAIFYNIGRLTSYGIAGMLFAWLGAALGTSLTPTFLEWGKWISGIFLLMLGLYIAGWLQALVILERLGNTLWRYIEPAGKHLLPANTYWKAALLGLVWGWLPCGMVYAMLPLAMSSANPVDGGIIMLAFGLGTLPTLLLMGNASLWLLKLTRNPLTRQAAGLLIILFAVYGILNEGAHEAHSTHMSHEVHEAPQ